MRVSSAFVTCVLLLLALAGCKTAPTAAPAKGAAASSTAPAPAPTASAPGAQTPAAKAAATKANLAIEKLRLSELFRGTPVLFALQPDGSLRAEVPLEFSFDTGRAAVKPPLAAVLDRIATGQRNEATQIQVRAPAEPASKSATLGADRAASVRDYLVAHGLADARVTVLALAAGAVVRIVVSELSEPVVGRR